MISDSTGLISHHCFLSVTADITLTKMHSLSLTTATSQRLLLVQLAFERVNNVLCVCVSLFML